MVRFATALQLTFADHVHEFNAGNGNGCGPERFESQHRPGHSLDRTVVLLDNIIEILDLSEFDA